MKTFIKENPIATFVIFWAGLILLASLFSSVNKTTDNPFAFDPDCSISGDPRHSCY